MVPKIWVSLASLRDEEGGRGRLNDNLNLGLYREEGQERNRPVYKQVDGFYRLISRDNRWLIISLDRSEEEEVIIQTNPRLPDLSAKKWEVPTHKVKLERIIGKLNQILFQNHSCVKLYKQSLLPNMLSTSVWFECHFCYII